MWLSTFPLKDEEYCLNKQEVWNLVKLRYGWPLSRLPTPCICGTKKDMQYVLSFKNGGFITVRHNHIRNVTTQLLVEVTKDGKI